MTHLSQFQHVLLFLSIGASCARLSAGTITIPDTYAGAATSHGDIGIASNGEYEVGELTDLQGPVEYRNYISFEIPVLPGPLESAVLELNGGALLVPDSGQVYWVTGLGLFFTFDDLGTLTPYGSVTLQNSDSFQPVDIQMNANALAQMTAFGNYFIVSGRFIDPQPETVAFEATWYLPAELILTYASPEPGTLPLALAGLALLAAIARRGTSSQCRLTKPRRIRAGCFPYPIVRP